MPETWPEVAICVTYGK